MVHAVKCLPKYFAPLLTGDKTFEVRKNDRPYRVGDYLAVNEFVPESEDPYDNMPEIPISTDQRRADGGRYSGKCLIFKITYILEEEEYCKNGMIILGLHCVKGRK